MFRSILIPNHILMQVEIFKRGYDESKGDRGEGRKAA